MGFVHLSSLRLKRKHGVPFNIPRSELGGDVPFAERYAGLAADTRLGRAGKGRGGASWGRAGERGPGQAPAAQRRAARSSHAPTSLVPWDTCVTRPSTAPGGLPGTGAALTGRRLPSARRSRTAAKLKTRGRGSTRVGDRPSGRGARCPAVGGFLPPLPPVRMELLWAPE